MTLVLPACTALLLSCCGLSPGWLNPAVNPVSYEQILAWAREALAALERERQVDGRTTVWQVEVAVAQGRVTLTGKSSSPQLKDEAVAALRRLPGVREVNDAIQLLPHPSLGDKVRGVISLPVVNLGDAPGRADGKHVVTQAVLGMVVDGAAQDNPDPRVGKVAGGKADGGGRPRPGGRCRGEWGPRLGVGVLQPHPHLRLRTGTGPRGWG